MYILTSKTKQTYNCDNINQPKASNNTTDGDISPLIKSEIESLDALFDNLLEDQETDLCKTSFVNLQFSLKQEYKMRTLPPIKLHQFSGNSIDWPEFIKNFPSMVHFKTTFDNNLRMDRLCSILDREAKRVIRSNRKK